VGSWKWGVGLGMDKLEPSSNKYLLSTVNCQLSTILYPENLFP
jgi:hypothetical protein